MEEAVLATAEFLGLVEYEALLAYAMKAFRPMKDSSKYGACLNFVVNAILIPKNGAVGAAIATVLAESIVMIIQVHYSWKEMKAAFLKIPYGKLFLINSIATGCLLAFKMMNFEWHAFMKCVVGAILFFGVYGALLLILMEPLVIQYGEPILRKLCAKVKNRE